MRELLEMMEAGAKAESVYMKMAELYQSGELKAAAEPTEAARMGSPNLSDLAGNYRNTFGACDIGTRYEIEENFWIKKLSTTLPRLSPLNREGQV